MALTKKEKQEFVENLKKELEESKVVAVASVQNLPARHYNSIRKKITGKAKIVFARATLLKRALEAGKPEAKELEKHMQGSCALLLSNEDVFKVAKTLRQNRSKTKAKPGQPAPSDIVVPAGETSLPPGPVLTELKQAGIQARIQGPKVVISKDATVAKKGEAITPAAAAILSKLAIEPMEVGMSLKAAYDNGMMFGEEVLGISDEYWLDSLVSAHRQALNLCVYAEIYNKYSTELIIKKAAREANALRKETEKKEGGKTEGEKAGEEKKEVKEGEKKEEKPKEEQPKQEEKKVEGKPAEKKEETKSEGKQDEGKGEAKGNDEKVQPK